MILNSPLATFLTTLELLTSCSTDILINTRALCYREYIHLARKLGITGSSQSDSVNPSTPRATIMCYERLHVDFDGEVTRLAAALGVPLTPAKLAAVRKCVHLLFARLPPFVLCFPPAALTLFACLAFQSVRTTTMKLAAARNCEHFALTRRTLFANTIFPC